MNYAAGHHIVTATEARRRFFKLLNAVQVGATFTITLRGVPIAHMGPAGPGAQG